MTVTQPKKTFQELKEPIISIIGMTDLLKDSELGEEERSYIKNIEKSAQALLAMVNKMIETPELKEAELPRSEELSNAVTELKSLVEHQSGVSAPNSTFSKLKVLVVEDNPLLQLVIMKQLSHFGIQAAAVGDGKEAVEAASDKDLIIMDCRLPVMDGFEATRAIRKTEKTSGKHCRIVALTAGYEDNIREKCLDSGMDDCIIKPAGSQELKRVIEKWFSEVNTGNNNQQ